MSNGIGRASFFQSDSSHQKVIIPDRFFIGSRIHQRFQVGGRFLGFARQSQLELGETTEQERFPLPGETGHLRGFPKGVVAFL